VNDAGFIESFASAGSSDSSRLLQDLPISPLVIPAGSFIVPTFCDLHLHAPQFLYSGTGLHLPLMQWLDSYAFKAEETLDNDPDLARKVYKRLAERLIESGTGAVLLFGTIKTETK
jgi:guanine deaminase